MYGIFIMLHLLVTVLLVIVVLFQQPQKGGVANVFGGGESVFGGGGAAPFMARLTSGLAILFMITSLTLVLLSAQRSRGPAQRPARQTQENIPETPATTQPQTEPTPAPTMPAPTQPVAPTGGK
jgi:preprotein translocase subunit SecG